MDKYSRLVELLEEVKAFPDPSNAEQVRINTEFFKLCIDLVPMLIAQFEVSVPMDLREEYFNVDPNRMK